MTDMAESNSPLVRRNVAVIRHHLAHPDWTYTQVADQVRSEGYGLPIDARRVGRLIRGWENMQQHGPYTAGRIAGTEEER